MAQVHHQNRAGNPLQNEDIQAIQLTSSLEYLQTQLGSFPILRTNKGLDAQVSENDKHLLPNAQDYSH
nr:hypothetical protein Iba_scaffold58032CG0010 [Ipomoea batatas]GMD82316.1 hypothetical protein Iba_scaffold52455CG0010 [Ipomoea batatas]GME00900.1 hypothetical protein Iba_scaffold56204CG0010 [Ipomoea batatas]